MKLDEWLKTNSVKRQEFAKRIGVSASMVTGLCNGSIWPGRDTVASIIRETEGAITADSFVRTGE